MRLLVAVVLLLLAASGASAATNYGFDFFVLVRQWGPTFCGSTNCSSAPVSKFTIHGLWPNYASGGYPKDCDPSDKLSTANLPQALVNQMSCEWVSYTGSNSGFWGYEWGKHGTCSKALLPTQNDYFNTTIGLNNRYEVNEVMAAANVAPSSPPLPPTQVQDLMQDAWGVRPLVSCNSSSLMEVWLCIDTSFKAIACPSSVRPRSCPSSVQLPQGAAVPAVCESYYSSSESFGASTPPSAPSGSTAAVPPPPRFTAAAQAPACAAAVAGAAAVALAAAML